MQGAGLTTWNRTMSCFLLIFPRCGTGFYLFSVYNLKMTTNISNLNLSKGTIPPLLKYKIVFLGDQAVGKSSIINRFIYDIFDGNEHVPSSPLSDPPSASISYPKTSSSRIKPFAFNSGTQPDKKDSKLSSLTTSETPLLLSLSMMLPIEILSKVFRNGSMMSKIREEKVLSLHYWQTKLILRIEMSARTRVGRWPRTTTSSSRKSVLKLASISNNFSNKLLPFSPKWANPPPEARQNSQPQTETNTKSQPTKI